MHRLKELAKSFEKHKATNNEFYDLWLSKPLTIEELQIFARNYGEWVKSFPDTLAMLFYTTNKVKAKTELIQTLFSEMGYGEKEKVHWKLLDNFFSHLAEKTGNKGKLERKFLKENIPILPSTKALIEGERKLYISENEALSIGAELALEWQAYTMIRLLYEGARNYKDHWKNQDEFHEACEYFYAHIGDAEKKHKQQSLEAAQQYAHKKESLKAATQYALDEKSFEEIKKGYNEHLDLIAGSWEGIYNEIKKHREKIGQ